MEFDDVMHNCLGAVIGAGIAILCSRKLGGGKNDF